MNTEAHRAAGKARRYARAEALDVARELCAVLKPVCARLIVAGSLRRGKIDVGDVEILFIPRFESRATGLFDWEEVSLADERVEELVAERRLAKRANVTGSFTWGMMNKLAVHVGSGMPVDLFTATPENWWNYVVCRTGPAALNTRIASAAQERGYKWNPYGAGFTRLSDGEVIPTWSEEGVFEFVGIEYREARERG